MEEIIVKLDIPLRFKKEFKLALANVVKEMVLKLKLSIARDIISKSRFTEKDADELSDKVKLSMHNDLRKKGFI